MALVGTVAVRFNGRPAVTITGFEYGADRPATVAAGGYGIIGTGTGVEKGSGSFKIRPRQETGIEFPLDTLRAPFSMAFPLGIHRFALLRCTMTSLRGTNEQESGNNEVAIQFVYEELKQVK